MLVVFAFLGAGCALRTGSDRWDAVRRQTIEPINATFHRHLPRDLKARDLDALAELYATERIGDLAWSGGELVGAGGGVTLAPVGREPAGTGTAVGGRAASVESGGRAGSGGPGAGFTEDVRRWHSERAAESVRAHYGRLLDLFPAIDKADLRILRVYWEAPEPEGLRADVRLLVRGAAGAVRRQLDQQMTIWIAARGAAWKITREEVRARELVASAAPFYEVATAAAGIDDVHDTTGSPPFRIVGGALASSGAAVSDVDADGDEDIILVSASRLRYYRNRGDGTFEDATAAAGLAAASPASPPARSSSITTTTAGPTSTSPRSARATASTTTTPGSSVTSPRRRASSPTAGRAWPSRPTTTATATSISSSSAWAIRPKPHRARTTRPRTGSPTRSTATTATARSRT